MPDSDKTVYAVWGENLDEHTGDKRPDWEQTRYILHYDANGGTGAVPADKKVVENGRVTLAQKPQPFLTKAVFVGWTEKAYEVFIEDPGVLLVKEIIMPAGDKTVYAGYGEDLNGSGIPGTGNGDGTGDGIPDYLQTQHILHYDTNGGAGSVPADRKIVENGLYTLRTEPLPTRKNAVYLGWSEGKHDVFKKAPADGVIVTEIRMGTSDKTVYAVWAIDLNNNGIPDYIEGYTEDETIDTPKTGDDNRLDSWLLLMFASGFGMALCPLALRKNRRYKIQ